MVVLDIGFKSEGTIPLEEFKDMPDLKVGDEVEVLLEHLEDQEGSVVLSKKKADFMRVWEKIRVAYETDQPVDSTDGKSQLAVWLPCRPLSSQRSCHATRSKGLTPSAYTVSVG